MITPRHLRRAVFAVLLFVTALALHGQVEPGASRSDVLRILGWPRSISHSDQKEILNYPECTVLLKDGRVEKLVFKSDRSRAQLWNQFDQQSRAQGQSPPATPAVQPSALAQTPAAKPIPKPQVTYQEPTPVRYVSEPPSPRSDFLSVVGWLGFVLAVAVVILVVATRHARSLSQFERDLLRKAGTAKPAPSPEPPVMAAPPRTESPVPKRKPDALRDGWSLALLQEIEWYRFENVAVAYEKALGRDARLTGFGADDGIDLKVFDPATSQLTRIGQCKAQKDWVGVKVIREFFGVMAHLKISQGVFYTTSSFTLDAVAFAQGKPLELVDGTTLVSRIKQLDLATQIRLFEVAVDGDYTTPTCATCGIKMVFQRTKLGADFWRCRTYRCKSKIWVARDKTRG